VSYQSRADFSDTIDSQKTRADFSDTINSQKKTRADFSDTIDSQKTRADTNIQSSWSRKISEGLFGWGMNMIDKTLELEAFRFSLQCSIDYLLAEVLGV